MNVKPYYLVALTGIEPPALEKTPSNMTWWKSVEGQQWRAYTDDSLHPSCEVSEIQLLTALPGLNHGDVGNYHYIVETDISTESEDEFNAWYDTEHLPGLALVPGTVSANRYLRVSGSPRYIACYELLSPSVMESKEWLAIRNTAWSSRVRPMFMNTVRQLFVRHTSQEIQ
jgi:hypothetical protein